MKKDNIPLSKARTSSFTLEKDPFLSHHESIFVNSILMRVCIQLAGVSHIKFSQSFETQDLQVPYTIEYTESNQVTDSLRSQWPRAEVKINSFKNRTEVLASKDPKYAYRERLDKIFKDSISEISEHRNIKISSPDNLAYDALLVTLAYLGSYYAIGEANEPLAQDLIQTFQGTLILSGLTNVGLFLSGTYESRGIGSRFGVLRSFKPERHLILSTLLNFPLTKVN